MNKYKVKGLMEETSIYTWEVEAKDEAEAVKIAVEDMEGEVIDIEVADNLRCIEVLDIKLLGKK